MLSRSAILVSLAAVALGLSTGDLTVKLSAVSSTVSSIDDIILTAVVSNPTSEDIKVVKFGTILDELPTKAFKVKKGDADVDFTGIDVIPDTSDDAAFITIPAGQSIALNHTVAASYDFESSGTGTFTFSTITNFQVSEASELTYFSAAESESVSVEVTDDVSKRFVFPEDAGSVGLRTSTPVCSDTNRRNFLAASLSEARAVAGGAAANIRQSPNSARLNTYFGNANRDDLWYNFDRVAGDLASSGNRGLHCVDRAGGACSGGGVVAYTNYAVFQAYFCNSFFSAQPLSAICGSSTINFGRANVMLHELTHAVFGSNDVVYGCPGSKNLSVADKKRNADNYSCFALELHRSLKC
ncbi:hypothetical protein BDV98DRAFT_533901 [Pterulicium gracile]|uniref:deuterolysin n=1 Tax=Pterulicium gracile TaxID=1884261 RepID=A0A5C3Q9L7_9AGAR|nr:hypothetical protein BDV98DRAFT_533901 [Pterula gracilis]